MSESNTMEMKRALWLEDQFEDLITYSSRLSRIDYVVDPVKSVSKALEKLEKNQYDVCIFDLKVLPGDAPEWLALDERKREEDPDIEPLLGLELLRSIYNAKQEKSKLWGKIKFDFSKVIVFSVVNDEDISEELESFGIPSQQILPKSGSDLDTLAEAIQEMEGQFYEE